MTEHIIRPTLIYIIRLWAEPDRDSLSWRVTLQEVGTKLPAPNAIGFSSFSKATNFIQTEMEMLSDQYKDK